MAPQGGHGPGWHGSVQRCGHRPPGRRLPHTWPHVCGVRKGSGSGSRTLPQKQREDGVTYCSVVQPGQRHASPPPLPLSPPPVPWAAVTDVAFEAALLSRQVRVQAAWKTR